MGDFNAIAVGKNLDDLNKQLEDQIVTLQQQQADNSLLIASLEEENSNLQDSVEEKSYLIETYEEEIKKLKKEIADLSERNKTLRRERDNDQVDINNLRSERKVLQDLLNKIVGGLKQLVMLAKPPSADAELIVPEEIAEADRGKYKGVFVCSRELTNINPRNFERLVKELPQINWGDAPAYVLKDQSTLRFCEGTTLVVFFSLKVTHPAIKAMKHNVKLTGANLIVGANINKMIGLIKKWLENPDFGWTGIPHPLL